MASLVESNVFSAVADRRGTDLRYRQRQLQSLQKWARLHVTKLEHAICADNDFCEAEAQLVIAFALGELREKYDGLDLRQELDVEYKIKNNHDNKDRRVPEELVYLIPEDFTPFLGVMSALCACIAAGSCCIVELPFDLHRVSALLRRMFSEALDPLAFGFVSERPAADFLKQCLVVDQRMSTPCAPAKRLLHAGSSSAAVAIIDRTADVKSAAKAIATSVTWFSGRGPHAPACILVNEFVKEKFLHHLNTHMSGGKMRKRQERHVKLAAQKGIRVESSAADAVQLKHISHTYEVSFDSLSAVGAPILLTVTSLDDAIDTVDSKASDPARVLYIFAQPKPAKYLGQYIRARVVFVNHVPVDMLVGPAAPFTYPALPGARYRREMFENCSPQFAQSIPGSIDACGLALDNSSTPKALLTGALYSLRGSGQAKEGDVNFFLQGIRIAVLVYILPASIATAGILFLGGRSLYKNWQF